MPRVVVMGVAGAGKTSVGRAIAARLGVPFVDADDLHSPDDRARMAAGQPLTDAQRARWIERVRDAMTRHEDLVVACSALRRTHRDRLRAVGNVELVLLDVPADELARRLRARPAHFFGDDLLASQLATLDLPAKDEGIVVADGTRPVEALADEIAGRRAGIRPVADGGENMFYYPA